MSFLRAVVPSGILHRIAGGLMYVRNRGQRRPAGRFHPSATDLMRMDDATFGQFVHSKGLETISTAHPPVGHAD